MGTFKLERCAQLLPVAIIFLLFASAFAQPTLSELRAITEEQPENAEAWVNLGNALLEEDSYEAAKEAFLEAIALDYLAGDAHFGLGLAEFGRGDFQAALFAFNELTRLHPERFDGHYNRAVTLARLRRPADSAAAFREAVAQAEPEAAPPEVAAAYIGLADQLKRSGDFAGAAEAYASALENEPRVDPLELRYLRADALYRAGRGLEALPDLTDLEGQTTDYRVSSLIADIYVDQGQVDYALRALERGLRKARVSEDAEVQANLLVKLGLLQRQLGRDAEAAASFQQAAEVNASSWEALYNLGVSYLEMGQPANAVQVLQNASEIEGAGGQVDLALASAFDQLGRTEFAIGSARRALNQLDDPQLAAQARLILGRSLYRQGDYQQAATVLAQVVQERPSDPQAQLWAGLAEYQLGNYRTAAQYYERAVQLAPGSAEARANLGAAYLATERFRDAEAVYELLVQQNPQDAESHYNLGWALMSQNRRAEARSAWQMASELGYAPASEALQQYF
ncbi:MAG TPA: tetratricopeptide repeat protein [Trueperaceae bacterium]